MCDTCRRHGVQGGAGPLDGRVAEQQDMPAALRQLRFFVRKNGPHPSYYTTLGELAGVAAAPRPEVATVVDPPPPLAGEP